MGDIKLLITIVLILTYFNISAANINSKKDNLRGTTFRKIEVAALGRIASIGQLYNSRSDRFMHQYLVKNVPQSSIDTTDNIGSYMKYMNSNTLKEKLEYLNIEADLKLSVLSGLVKVGGSGQLLKDKNINSNSVKVTLSTIITSKYDECFFTTKRERDLIDMNVLKNTEATHVVVGIEWGGKIFIAVEDSNSEGIDSESVKGRIASELDQIASAYMGQVSANVSSSIKDKVREYQCHVYGDFRETNWPKNVVEAMGYMDNAITKLTKGNGGKGSQLSYTLQPIAEVRKFANMTARVSERSLQSIDDPIIDSCVQWFEEMARNEDKIDELMAARKKYGMYFSKMKLANITRFSKDFNEYQKNVKSQLAKLLTQVRSGENTTDQLNNFLNDTNNHILSPRNINFKEFESFELEIKFFKYLSDLQVDILDRSTDFATYANKRRDKNIYAFLYSVTYPVYEESLSEFILLLRLRNKIGIKHYYVAIKDDVLDQIEKDIHFNFTTPSRLRVYIDAECYIDDYLTVKPYIVLHVDH